MDNKRLILFVIFSFSILLLWDAWQRQHAPVAPAEQVASAPFTASNAASVPASSDEAVPAAAEGFSLLKGQRISVQTDLYDLAIDTMGGDLRHLSLRQHRADDDTQKDFVLLDDSGKPMTYVAQTGLKGTDLPTHRESFTSAQSAYTLQEGANSLEVRLSAEPKNGIQVDKIYTFHRGNYAIDVRYEIKNGSANTITPSVYYQIIHDSESNQGSAMMPTFTGAAYYTEADKFNKIAFADMKKEELSKPTKDGWIGLVQHYFVSAWIQDQGVERKFYTKQLSDTLFSMGSISPVAAIPAGGSATIKARYYAGPQTQKELVATAPGLERVVDYGKLTFIASPLFTVLSAIQNYVKNWGVAIILLTVLIKAAFYWFSATSYRSMARMREIAPKLQAMKEKFGDDKQKMQQAMMELYRTEKINPMSGCLPILIQIPVFIALYWMLLGTVEMRHAPFFGWIQDLSAKDPYYILPILMGASMIIQSKLNPPPTDPVQAKVMQIMPVMMSIFFFWFPAGLVLYWLVNNILSIAQQWMINKTIHAETLAKQSGKNTKPNDTIAAVATASGAGGIGVVRVSGPLVVSIAQGILGHCPPPRHAAYLTFQAGDGRVMDRGIAIYYPNPHSYTDEDVLELQAHGGTALMHMVLARCLELGARQAEPGEFTRRAYLNEKMDLAQAEAVADLINAATEQAAKSAMRSLSGEFSKTIQHLLQRLIELRMYVEACLDFPEEEIDFITQGRVAEKLAAIRQALDTVFEQAKQGSLLREGIHVVLIGQPNVGKSSLMNQLAYEEVAIVTNIAGTTRDTIKSAIQIEGVPLHVIDTAGLRETEDEVEKFGIARTWRATESAHIALLLVDATHGIGETEKSILDRLPREIVKIWVHNKIDVSRETSRLEEIAGQTHVFLSAKTGEGLALLRQALLQHAGYQASGEGVFMARARHIQSLQQVQQHLSNAAQQLGRAELVAEELRLAQESLASITGEFTPDDLLGEIFSKFCIGK